MKENNSKILEYHSEQDVGHVSFLSEERRGCNPGWRRLGRFNGTMFQANEELERRIRLYKKGQRGNFGV